MATDAQITILVDNAGATGLTAEHGFALWMIADGHRLLFDTGQGPALATNAPALGVDLDTCDTLVLSHGHYDHTGGLPLALSGRRSPVVHAHPAVMSHRYAVRDGTARAIHMPPESVTALRSLKPGFLQWVTESVPLSPDIGLVASIPRETDFEDTGGPFFLDAGGTVPDPIKDDLAIWIRTAEGIVLCVGCCHAGLINTIRHVRRLTEMPLRAVIGGFHLVNADPRRLDGTVAGLRAAAPELIVPCHCTGDRAVAVLRDALGDIVQPGVAGMRFSFQRPHVQCP
ncbi:MAG: MBL fold metallo-hydrolase [Vicinamibacterales bacterium]|nr:MBL fold metallo-hydrolase [Vicinamibacterales bacterium]